MSIPKSRSEMALQPYIVQLLPNLWAVCFYLMKVLPAKFMLDRAVDRGLLHPGSVIVETSSGTFGLGLAHLCGERDYRLILVSDMDALLARRCSLLGTRVERVTQSGPEGIQMARLKRLHQLQEEYPEAYWPRQYENNDALWGYAHLAGYLSDQIGDVHCLVGAVGSGSSTCGTAHFLRSINPTMELVGADTFGSINFGFTNGERLIGGMGSSIIMPLLDHQAFDEVHIVTTAEAVVTMHTLYAEYGLFHGPSSGAAYRAARYYAETHPNSNTVVLFPDEGYRYLNEHYSPEWLREKGVDLNHLPNTPRQINHPLDAEHGTQQWLVLPWNRRSYEDVVGRTKPSYSSEVEQHTGTC